MVHGQWIYGELDCDVRHTSRGALSLRGDLARR